MNQTLPKPPEARASWRSFSAAPHRLFLWNGALYGVVVTLLWTVQQVSLHTTLLAPFSWTVPPPMAHGVMMVYGLLGFYLFGFLLTAFPRWVGGEPVSRGVYLAAWGCHTFGAHLFWVGLFVSHWLSVAGVVSMLVAYGIMLFALARAWKRTGDFARGQAPAVLLGLAMGCAGLLAAGHGLALWNSDSLSAARWIGVYPFALLVVLAVVRRMLPFFTATVTPGHEPRRAAWSLPLFCAVLPLRALAGWWPWPGLALALDAILLATLLWELALWRFWRANFPHLLVVLYLALGWIVLSLALSVGEGIYMAIDGGLAPPFRNAALHALAVGGFGGLMLGISTRVSLGHSGRGLATDRLLNVIFYTFQLVVLARIVPEVVGYWWPAWSVHGFWSGLGWAAVFGLWLVRMTPSLMRPRADGREG